MAGKILWDKLRKCNVDSGMVEEIKGIKIRAKIERRSKSSVPKAVFINTESGARYIIRGYGHGFETLRRGDRVQFYLNNKPDPVAFNNLTTGTNGILDSERYSFRGE